MLKNIYWIHSPQFQLLKNQRTFFWVHSPQFQLLKSQRGHLKTRKTLILHKKRKELNFGEIFGQKILRKTLFVKKTVLRTIPRNPQEGPQCSLNVFGG